MDGSGSNLTNLNFYANATSENPGYLSPIYINEASDLIVENNLIQMDYYDGCNYNLAGIYAFGASNNNIIRNNRISIYSKTEEESSKHYIYGIDFSTYSEGKFATANARNNTISSNMIDIVSDYYANSITLSCAVDTLVESNIISLTSPSFVYGMVAEYFDSGYGMEKSTNFTFANNTIEASSNMVYAIQFFGVDDVNVSDNRIRTISNGTYGISGYESHNHNIESNTIIISGEDISQIGINFDAIGSGHSGIYYMRDSSSIDIHDNMIMSNYTLGGDYAVKFDASSTENIAVYDNNLSSNNYNYLGNDAVSGDATVYDNNPYIENEEGSTTITNFTIVDIYVDLNGNDDKGNGSEDNPFLSINKALNYLKTLNENLDSNSNTRVKGIVHLGEGLYNTYPNSLRLSITNLTVDIIGVQNKTTIDGKGSHWFIEVSEDATVSIRNINFTNGTYRKNNVGLIHNRGNLSLENCSIINSKIPASSAVIYNDGTLSLKNNFIDLNGTAYAIYNNGILKLTNNVLNSSNKSKTVYNNGLIDNLYLNLVVDSLNEDERIINVNSTKLNLTAFVHDDNGNPITGGFVTFFVEGKEILVNSSLNEGIATLATYSSLHGIVKISGFYTNAYTNLNVNIGRINNALISDAVMIYVKLPEANSEEPSNGENEEDGSLEHPFTSINKAFSEIGTSIEPVTIYLLDDNFTEEINSSCICGANPITIQGNENKTHVCRFWTINTTTPIVLRDLVFDGCFLLKIDSDLTVDNCLFTNSPQSSIFSKNGSLTILNSNFTKNNVKDPHNANYYSSDRGDIPYYLIPFVEESFKNLYYERGGAIYNAFSNLTILNSNFIGNEAFYGGAIFNEQSDLHVSNTNFIGNIALSGLTNDDNGNSKGGAIFQYLGNEVVITDSLLVNNSADGMGGAFFSSGIFPNSENQDSHILGIDYIYKKDERGYINARGEVVENIVSPQDIYFINCTFDSNLAPKGGGGVFTVNNSLTSYISCNFLNNKVFTYEMFKLFETYSSVKWAGNWIYKDQIENMFSVVFAPANYGGAIHDNNLKIIDSTFTANTLESGGSVILPTVLTYTTERNTLSRSDVGITIANSVSGSESIYVADSSLLTAKDSAYIGINGWSGTSNGSSIVKIINGNSNSGSGGTESGNGEGSGSGGTGTGSGSGGLNWGDILSALGGDVNNIAINGDGSGIADYLNNLINGNSSSNSSSNSNGSGSSSSNGTGSNSDSNSTNPSNTSNGTSPNSNNTNSSSSSNSTNINPNSNSTDSNSSSNNTNPNINPNSDSGNPVENTTNNSSNSTESNPNDNNGSAVEYPESNTNSTENNENQEQNTNSTENPEFDTNSTENPEFDTNSTENPEFDTNSTENPEFDTNSTENSNDSEDSTSDSEGELVIDDNNEHSDVGESADPLSGKPSESSENSENSQNQDSSSNPADSSSPSPGLSSSSSPGSSSSSPTASAANAYKIYKQEIEDNVIQKEIDIDNLAKILILFFGLIILGYYKKSREDEK